MSMAASPSAGGAGGPHVSGQMQGTVKVWFEDKGYGFLSPSNGGNDVFVHRNALVEGQNLVINQLVSYVAEWNPQKNKYTATTCSNTSAAAIDTAAVYGKVEGLGTADSRFLPYGET